MAISSYTTDNENQKFVESADVAGQPGLVILNPDGSTVGGSSTSPSSDFEHGGNSNVGTSAEQIVIESTPAAHGVLIRAHKDNTGTVYIGKSDVTAGSADATDGMPLQAGESLTLNVDNANKVYAIGSAAGQKLFWVVD